MIKKTLNSQTRYCFILFRRCINFHHFWFSQDLDSFFLDFMCHRMRAMICTTERPLPSSWSMLISVWFLGSPILRDCWAVRVWWRSENKLQGTGMIRYDGDHVYVAQCRERWFQWFHFGMGSSFFGGHSDSGSMFFGTAWYRHTVALEVSSLNNFNTSRHRIGTQGASVHLPKWYCLGLVY